jgi:hypothetical protein
MTRTVALSLLAIALVLSDHALARASGHGPVFGAATPTLGRGGWSVDQAWTIRLGEESTHEQMFKTMVSFGITEVVQISLSVPLVMTDSVLTGARMMSPMSNDKEFESLLAYRFQRKPVGIGGRRESTLYVGGTVPGESYRLGAGAGPSLMAGVATGYASRIHYVWAGGAVQHYFERFGDRLGESRLVTAVYGYRPPVFRADAGKPDVRFFVELTAEHRGATSVGGVDVGGSTAGIFAGPTSLLVYKAIALEGGIMFPLAQRIPTGGVREHARVAINAAYFFWLK